MDLLLVFVLIVMVGVLVLYVCKMIEHFPSECIDPYLRQQNRRRIVWVFDESKEGEKFGRFSLPETGIDQWPNRELTWKHNPRRCLLSIRDLRQIGNMVAIFVAPTKDNDYIYRLVKGTLIENRRYL